MQGTGTCWRCIFRKARISRHLLRFRNQVEPCDRQCRRVQNLTNVAGCFRTIVMRMEKCEARSDVQQQHAAKYSQGWPREPSAGSESQTHTDTIV